MADNHVEQHSEPCRACGADAVVETVGSFVEEQPSPSVRSTRTCTERTCATAWRVWAQLNEPERADLRTGTLSAVMVQRLIDAGLIVVGTRWAESEDPGYGFMIPVALQRIIDVEPAA